MRPKDLYKTIQNEHITQFEEQLAKQEASQSKVETMPATLSSQQKLLELDERPNMLKRCDCEVGRACWRGKHQ